MSFLWVDICAALVAVYWTDEAAFQSLKKYKTHTYFITLCITLSCLIHAWFGTLCLNCCHRFRISDAAAGCALCCVVVISSTAVNLLYCMLWI